MKITSPSDGDMENVTVKVEVKCEAIQHEGSTDKIYMQPAFHEEMDLGNGKIW